MQNSDSGNALREKVKRGGYFFPPVNSSHFKDEVSKIMKIIDDAEDSDKRLLLINVRKAYWRLDLGAKKIHQRCQEEYFQEKQELLVRQQAVQQGRPVVQPEGHSKEVISGKEVRKEDNLRKRQPAQQPGSNNVPGGHDQDELLVSFSPGGAVGERITEVGDSDLSIGGGGSPSVGVHDDRSNMQQPGFPQNDSTRVDANIERFGHNVAGLDQDVREVDIADVDDDDEVAAPSSVSFSSGSAPFPREIIDEPLDADTFSITYVSRNGVSASALYTRDAESKEFTTAKNTEVQDMKDAKSVNSVSVSWKSSTDPGTNSTAYHAGLKGFQEALACIPDEQKIKVNFPVDGDKEDFVKGMYQAMKNHLQSKAESSGDDVSKKEVKKSFKSRIKNFDSFIRATPRLEALNKLFEESSVNVDRAESAVRKSGRGSGEGPDSDLDSSSNSPSGSWSNK